MLKVLFVCVHNSARSQMAEAFFNHDAKESDTAESAGIEPGQINPYVVKAMGEKGFDISNNATKGVFDLYKEGRKYSHVIAVCDAEASQRCPIFPGVIKKELWSFPDPSAFTGTEEEIMEQVRNVRDAIEQKVKALLEAEGTKQEKEIDAQHMPSSIKIPLNELPMRLNELDKNKTIVTACPHKDRAIMARTYLKRKGFDARYLKDGLTGLAEYWRGDSGREFIEEYRKLHTK
jgi:arsenate reductase